MAMSMAHLLVHDDFVPVRAREALRAATSGPPELRAARLELAARVLHRETGLDCRDVRDLVGLPGGDC